HAWARGRTHTRRGARPPRRVIALEPDRVSGFHALAEVLADRREHRAIVDTLGPALTRLEGKDDARSLAAVRGARGWGARCWWVRCPPRRPPPPSPPPSRTRPPPRSTGPAATAAPMPAS